MNTSVLIRNAHTAGTETSSITFSYDGRNVATRGGDDTLKLWDIRQTKKAVHVAEDLFSRFSMYSFGFLFFDIIRYYYLLLGQLFFDLLTEKLKVKSLKKPKFRRFFVSKMNSIGFFTKILTNVDLQTKILTLKLKC